MAEKYLAVYNDQQIQWTLKEDWRMSVKFLSKNGKDEKNKKIILKLYEIIGKYLRTWKNFLQKI